jgi:hypothetical protein
MNRHQFSKMFDGPYSAYNRHYLSKDFRSPNALRNAFRKRIQEREVEAYKRVCVYTNKIIAACNVQNHLSLQ